LPATSIGHASSVAANIAVVKSLKTLAERSVGFLSRGILTLYPVLNVVAIAIIFNAKVWLVLILTSSV